MPGMNQAEFARYIGRDPSHVTRLKQAGRLVLTADGLVDAEASVARIHATRGQRFDVEARFEELRGAVARIEQAAATAGPPEADLEGAGPDAPEAGTEAGRAVPADPLDIDVIGRRTRYAQMLKAEAEARTKAREDLQAAGETIPRAAVRADLETAVGGILNAFEGLPDRLAPVLVGMRDQAAVRAVLRDEIELTLARIADTLGAVAAGPGAS